MRREKVWSYCVVERFVLDTSVIVDYIVLRSAYRPKVVKLFDKVLRSELELYVSPITLGESLYVASRIYEASGIKDPKY